MNSAIWGSLLILFGISLVIKAVFGIDIPILRIAFGLFLIYVGINCITGWNKNFTSLRICKVNVYPKKINDYQNLFNSAIIDLSDVSITDFTKIKTETIFGSTTIIIDPNIPTMIKIDTSFANTQLPDKTHISFGSYTYKTDNCEEHPLLEIHAKVVFGNLIIKNR